MDQVTIVKKGTESGVKHDTGKLRYDLYPIDAYKGCTKVITFGAEKYTPNGWKDVKPKRRYYAALMRHILAQIEYEEQGGKGLALDEESGLPHLDHAQCCLIFYREITNTEKQAIRAKNEGEESKRGDGVFNS